MPLSASASPPDPSTRDGRPAAASRGQPPANQLLPDFCSLPVAVGVVVYSELLALLLALASPSPLHSLWERLGPLSLLVLIIALSAASLLCGLRRAMGHLPAWLAALLSWVMIVAIAMITAWSSTRLLPWGGEAGLFPADGTAGLLLRAALIAAIISGLLLRYLYLHAQWRNQVVAVANARLQTLQARIRPHFLFNSMNTIASLIRSNPRLAETVLEDLADLFRATLGRETETTLGQEIDLARRYLNIEAQRLGARMRVDWELVDLPEAAPLPPLILQPLVENAVYHGIQASAAPGRISIVGRCRRGMVELTIRNTAPDRATPERLPHHGNKMALTNVTQRMEAMFPGLARVTQSRDGGDYVVRITFPHLRSPV